MSLLTRGLGGAASWLLTRGLGASAAVAAPVPATLTAAVVAAWTAGGLDASVGPLFDREAPPDAPLPRCTMQVVASAGIRHTAGDTYTRDVLIQFAILSTSDADAEARGELVKAAYAPSRMRAKLRWLKGTESTARLGPCPLMRLPGRTRDNRPIWQQIVQYVFVTGNTW